MDVDHMSSIRVDKNNNRERWVAFNRATGARMSAMEHLVPEEMYSTEDNPAHGISAVKALQLAAAEGQKIWTITQSNLSQAMAALNLSSSVEADIRNAVRAGKEVTAHEDTINFHGRPSAGYMVIDPETGAGGYLIAGGENGGFLDFLSEFSTWYAFAFSIKAELVASPSDANKVAIRAIASTVTNFLSLIGLSIDIFDIVTACGQKGTVLTLFTLLGYLGPLLSLMFLAALLPVFWGVVAGVAIALSSRWYKELTIGRCS